MIERERERERESGKRISALHFQESISTAGWHRNTTIFLYIYLY